jgi:hypothetical protein
MKAAGVCAIVENTDAAEKGASQKIIRVEFFLNPIATIEAISVLFLLKFIRIFSPATMQ